MTIDRNHYRNVKDLDEVRPRYAPTPKAPKGCGRAFGLYLQDQASHVMCDKYGLEKGHELWENSIGAGKNGGAMFAMSQEVTDQKYQMCCDLGIFPIPYFERSYLSIWKEWAPKFGKKKVS